jgi:hypothetical protein
MKSPMSKKKPTAMKSILGPAKPKPTAPVGKPAKGKGAAAMPMKHCKDKPK